MSKVTTKKQKEKVEQTEFKIKRQTRERLLLIDRQIAIFNEQKYLMLKAYVDAVGLEGNNVVVAKDYSAIWESKDARKDDK